MITSDSQTSNNPVAAPSTEDFVITEKQSPSMFIFTELMIYFSQIMMFFLTAALTSNLLRDEKQLLSYMSSKINENTIHDVLATMLGIAATVGIIASITKASTNSPWLERIADEVLNEAPRTAYFFGSSSAGTMLAIALFIHNYPQEGASPMWWLLMAILYGMAGFMYGCMFAYAFKHRTHIKKTVGASI